MDSKEIFEQLDAIDDLPTLPAVAMELNGMLQDYDISMDRLTRTIEKDQALVPRILRLVNSAFFGLASRIGTISHAVMILGFNTMRNAVMSVSIIEAFSNKDLNDLDATTFWTHSMAVAVISRHLALKTALGSPGDSFTAGLVHDMGKIVLAHYFEDLFREIWRSVKEDGISFYEAEKKEIPVTHAVVGAYLAEKWQLPRGIIDTIRYHHTPDEAAADPGLLSIVHGANLMANTLVGGNGSLPDYSPIHPDAAALTPLFTNAHEWLPAVKGEIESASAFFEGKGGEAGI